MDLLLLIIIGVCIWAMIYAPYKRSKVQKDCPKCGTRCNASPWGTSLQYEKKFKCPKCGHKFNNFDYYR